MGYGKAQFGTAEQAVEAEQDVFSHQPRAAFNADGTVRPVFVINGAEVVEAEFGRLTIQLLDVNAHARNILWYRIAEGLGFEGKDVPDEIADGIAALVFKYDMMKMLADRIQMP